ncbi:MAG: RtcB family protein [Halanaerobiales bacterium]|nr:RtcB family protein [Halanaerobiales bacterium]
MKNVIYNRENQNVPIKTWTNDIEQGALEQALNMSRLPFVFKHIALMPDVHRGYGVPIGGVMATKDVIIPNAVGVDIGCGMIAQQTNLKEITEDTLKKILGLIRQNIPTGFSRHKETQDESHMPKVLEDKHLPVIEKEYESALYQIGTLGGGNHFIEFQKDENDNIWIMIHSGSRNLGYKVAKYYNEKAIELNEMWYSQVPKKYELAFLPPDTDEYRDYINEMKYALKFALCNRRLMLFRVMDIMKNCVRKYDNNNFSFVNDYINIHHNYASIENHFGKNVWIHRKGATLAREGTIGIIPGSQGTSSYIVEGKSNKQSFTSCSHGAGRLMSRTKAKNDLDLYVEKGKLEDKGILHSIRGKKDLDEASGAYKNIDIVMENQKDLVDIIHKLEPIAVIKG